MFKLAWNCNAVERADFRRLATSTHIVFTSRMCYAAHQPHSAHWRCTQPVIMLLCELATTSSPEKNPTHLCTHRVGILSRVTLFWFWNCQDSQPPGGIVACYTAALPFPAPRGFQRDVVYLGWPIAPTYMSPNAGVGKELWVLSQWVQLYTGAQINFGDLTQYLTYACTLFYPG